MTNDELLAEVKAAWEHWAPHLGLELWQPTFKIQKLKDSNLQCHVQDGYLRVLIKIASNNDFGERLVIRAVLHEMLHVILSACGEWAWRHATMHVGHKTSDLTEYTAAEESTVDWLEGIIWRLHESGHKNLQWAQMQPASYVDISELVRDAMQTPLPEWMR